MKTARALALILAVGVLLSAIVYFRFGSVAYNGDALYDAQVARNVVAGRGYVTNEMPLYAVNLYRTLDLSLAPPWYNAHKFPLPVYIKAGFIRLFGDTLASVTFLYSAVFYLLLAVAVFVFGRLVWRERPAFALLASLLVLLNPVLGFGTPYLMMSGLNLVVDAFLFVVLAAILYAWWQRRTLLPLTAAGLISGIAFLDRYNAGLYIVAVFALLAVCIVRQRGQNVGIRQALKNFAVAYAAYSAGFIVVIAPFIAWNLASIGRPLLSINGVFQILFDTPFNSFIDPWYKLEYVFPTNSPWLFALTHPAALATKWFKYAALDVIRFVSFEGVLWWTALVCAFYLLAHTDRRNPAVASILVVLKWTLALAVLQVLILPFWAGSVAYFFYLFPLFSLPIAYVLIRSYDALEVAHASRLFSRSLRELLASFARIAAHRSAAFLGAILLVVFALLLLAYQSTASLTVGLSAQSYLVAGLALATAAGILILAYAAPRLAIPSVLALGALYFIAQTGLTTATSQSAIAAARWDIEERPQTVGELVRLAHGGVSLSATPWNTVWWSGNKLTSLPIPEYPDEIDVLSKSYGLRIDSVYLHKLDLYPVKYASYAWSAYARAVEFGYPLEGFSVAGRVADGEILARTRDSFAWPTTEIDPGDPSASAHLIWGWGEDMTVDGRSAAPIGSYRYLVQQSGIVQGTQSSPLKSATTAEEQAAEPYPMPIGTSGSTWTVRPDADMTFLLDKKNLPSTAAITLRTAKGGGTLELFLNGNLLAVGAPAVDLGSYAVSPSWQTLQVPLPQDQLRDGINKLSFVFYGAQSDTAGALAYVNKVSFSPGLSQP